MYTSGTDLLVKDAMATARKQETFHELTKEEAWRLFDARAMATLKMSGKDFLAAWHAGKFAGGKEDQGAAELSILMPLVEQP